MGAVAQMGRQPRPQPHFDPITAMLPSFMHHLPQVPKMPKLNPAEMQARNVMKSGNLQKYYAASPKVKGLLMSPSPRLQMHLDYNPQLRQQHQQAMSITGWNKAQPRVEAPSPAEAKIMHQREYQAAHAKPMTEGIAGVPLFSNPVAAWGQRLVGGLGQSAIDAGVGMAHLPGALYHHPLGTPEAMGKNMGESMLGMFTHPGREFVTNPSEGVMNLATLASFGAGSVARVGKAAEVLGAAGRGEMTAGEAAKGLGSALYRTPRMERSIKPLPGDTSLRLQPPAFKSSLGGYWHTKAWDPLMEHAIEARAAGNEGVNFLGKNIPFSPQVSAKMSSFAERHMGKLLRRDVEIRTQMERGGMEAKLVEQAAKEGKLMPPPKGIKGRIGRAFHPDPAIANAQAEAYATHAATSHANLWKSLWDGGASPKVFEKNPDAYVGVRKPPTSWTQKDMAKYSSERQIFHQWNRTVETDPAKLAADPEAYQFIPKAMWKRLRPGERSYGDPVVKGMNMIDAGNQAIRTGRFIHPGYAAWGLQNAVFHLSQAGMHVFRNIYQYRNEVPKFTAEDRAKFLNSVGAGHFGGGIARATGGGEESYFRGATKGLAGMWHSVDDKVPRTLSLIHELNRMGYHNAEDWSKLMKENPVKFRSIAQKAQHQAIDYAEMSPTERATMQKLFTAYGWTRGASTYTARFALEHPVQASVLAELSREGAKQRDAFWSKQGGMVPEWLRSSMPLDINSKHPGLLATGDINPGETFGQALGALGLLPGPSGSASEQLGPAAQGLFELGTGRDSFGNQIRGGITGRAAQAMSDTLKRFTPYSYLNMLTGAKKGGGTFQEGALPFALSELGVPYKQLRDPKTTAALGMKDWEQSLTKPDEIKFRYQQALKQFPQELSLYAKKNGTPLDRGTIAKIKGDFEAVQQRDLWQYNYAQSKGANSFRALPAIDKATAGIKFMVDHKYMHPSDVASAMQGIQEAKRMGSEAEMNTIASEIWGSYPIGQIANTWKSTMKAMQPVPLQPARG